MKFSITSGLLNFFRQNYLRIFLILLIISATAFAVNLLGFEFEHINIIKKYDFASKIESFGYWAPVLFILLYTAKTFFVVVPSSPLVVLGGSLFGWFYGFLYSMVGSLLSATLAFFLARFAGRDFVLKIAGKRINFVNDKVQNFGIRIIAAMRISFVVPFDVLSYGAGLTKIKYRDFFIGTFLGIVAEIFSLNYMGKNMENMRSKGFFISLAMLVIVIFVPMAVSKYYKKREIAKNKDLNEADFLKVAPKNMEEDIMSEKKTDYCKEDMEFCDEKLPSLCAVGEECKIEK